MKLYKREIYLSKLRGFYDATDIVKVITGVRRAGKSSIIQLVIDELKGNGIDDNNIIMINLAQRGYKNIRTTEALESRIDELSQIADRSKIKYLFIDEIQYVPGFEAVVNSYRAEGDRSIFITGSNSYLLSSEIGTRLTGRYVSLEVYTLNFQEYESMKEFYGKPINPNPLVELDSYIREGGFPRTVLFDDYADKQLYTQSIVNEIFEKDIKTRAKIKNANVFNSVTDFIIGNFGSTFSINSLELELRKTGNTISRATLARYVSLLLDAKIIYECERFDTKSKKVLSGEKKYYLSDTSFYYSRNTDNKVNYGPALENMVFIYAKSKNYSVSVGKIGSFECDFIVRSPSSGFAYIQVCYSILSSKDTENREYRPLEKIKDNWPKYIASADYSLQKRNGIQHINILDFIKQDKDFC